MIAPTLNRDCGSEPPYKIGIEYSNHNRDLRLINIDFEIWISYIEKLELLASHSQFPDKVIGFLFQALIWTSWCRLLEMKFESSSCLEKDAISRQRMIAMEIKWQKLTSRLINYWLLEKYSSVLVNLLSEYVAYFLILELNLNKFTVKWIIA